MKGVFISKDDELIPEFKYAPLSSPLIEDESIIERWYVIRNIKYLDGIPCAYEQVRHLVSNVINSQIGIEIRAAMEVLCKRNEDISEYFDLDDMANWNTHRAMINVHIFTPYLRK